MARSSTAWPAMPSAWAMGCALKPNWPTCWTAALSGHRPSTPICPRTMRPAAAACPVFTWPAMAQASWVRTRRRGEREGVGVGADHGRAGDGARARQLERRLGQLRRVGQALARAFPLPADWAAQAPDALLLCRCENITAGQLRACARETGADEMNRLKALTRIGMGRCQGRICALAGAEILAQATGRPVEQVGRLRGQAPIKPIPLHLQTQQVADGTDAAAPPRDE